MYHTPNRKKHIAKLVAIYTLMSTTVVVTVAVLLLIMLGYQFNKNDGTISQGGLMQFNSRPTGASVTIDGAGVAFSTPNKSTVTAGAHDVVMKREGYNDWQKKVFVSPSEVLWLNYARLIPQNIAVSSVATYDTMAASLASPSRRYILVKPTFDAPDFVLVDIASDTIKQTPMSLPAEAYTGADASNHQFVMREWDKDNRFVLIAHAFTHADKQKTEWLVLDTERPAESRNITTTFGIDASKVQFSVGDSHLLYILTPSHEVRKINLNDATISRPLVTNAADFEQYDRATLTYVTIPAPETNERIVGYYTDNAKTVRVVKKITTDPSLPIYFRIAEYFNEKYFMIMSGVALDITKGGLPSSDSRDTTEYKPVTSISLPRGSQATSFGMMSRFVVSQYGANVTVYDLELNKKSDIVLAGDDATMQPISWLDNFHFTSSNTGKLTMYEFDGANKATIMDVTPGARGVLTSNDKYIYSFIGRTDGKIELRRAQMVL